MKSYYPKSWSQQAREMCDRQIGYINVGWSTIENATKFFSTSYRNSLIRERAAKRFGRLVRQGKVHENLEEYYSHFSQEEEDGADW